MVVQTFKGFRLNAFQRRAVSSIRRGANVLVMAPTGAGKTLVAEYAIHLAMQHGKRCIYTAPIKALSNQKYRDFRDDPQVDVGIMTGDVTINPAARLLIMTTEILRNSIFEDPARLHDVDYVIFDEIHFMDDIERGSVWEESIIFAPPDIRIIGLSATIENADELGAWIRSVRPHMLDIIEDHHRPVPLQHEFFHPSAGFFGPQQLARARAKARRLYPPNPARSSRALIDHLIARDALPVLFFCFSRRECEKKARVNLWRKLLNKDERRRMEVLFDEICELYQLQQSEDLDDLRQQALRGIGYHHAGGLPIHKEVVERLFTSGLIKLLFTTETFALGINMPARTVVFNSLRKFDGVSFDFLKTRDYMQMAGRAGRQGIDTEGTVISILDTNDLHDAPLVRLAKGRAEPIHSHFNLSYTTLIQLRERLGDQIYEAWEKSFNAFQFRDRSKKALERNRRRHLHIIERRLLLLEELGYLDGTRVLDRGRIAAQIQGYELQVTELLFEGLLDDLDPQQLAIVGASLVFEERRGDSFARIKGPVIGSRQYAIERCIRTVAERETVYNLPPSIKLPCFSIAVATRAWTDGTPFADLEHLTNISPGDLVRTLRSAIQLLRQLKMILTEEYVLHDLLGQAIVLVDRDEVDARRQLELG